MITIIPIEPLNDEYAFLIIEAFNKLFVNKGGKTDGYGCGMGCLHGDGHSGWYTDVIPEEWLINESSRQPADGHI